jgi:signal transduction histidine kinase
VRAAEVSTLGIVDPGRLGQCVANLLENALKFATTALWVDTHVAEDGTVSVHITDDGPGIAPNDLPRVFERLYVTDRIPRRPVGGSGLGLAIVHQLTEGMGATVHAESPALPDGRGARFVITLPG